MVQFMPLLQVQDQTGQLVGMLVPFGLIILVFYFLIIRPQNKKQKETQAMLAALKRNDRVVTIGGIRGTVYAIKDDAVILKVDDDVKIEFNKSAIAAVLKPQTVRGGSRELQDGGEANSSGEAEGPR